MRDIIGDILGILALAVMLYMALFLPYLLTGV